MFYPITKKAVIRAAIVKRRFMVNSRLWFYCQKLPLSG
jgi:hypothetical protein